MEEKKKYLILENGRVFEGKAFGAEGETIGEIVFSTEMVGCLETLTNPGYTGQLVAETFPLIGNYGVIPADFESRKAHPAGYIVREWCRDPSNYRCEGTIDAFLKEQGVVGISGIDTRALTRSVREQGTMNGLIADSPELTPERKAALENYAVRGAVSAVTRKETQILGTEGGPEIALLDFGVRRSLIDALIARGCRIAVMPAGSSFEEIAARKPDGLMLSNGPGNPADEKEIINEIRKALESGMPVFGVGLGHQLLALAAGGRTEKMKHGHRGASQPVRDEETGSVYVTNQSHGYVVSKESLPKGARIRYTNPGDGSCEGIDYRDGAAFSVQFYPDPETGASGTGFLFDRFVAMIQKNKEKNICR